MHRPIHKRNLLFVSICCFLIHILDHAALVFFINVR